MSPKPPALSAQRRRAPWYFTQPEAGLTLRQALAPFVRRFAWAAAYFAALYALGTIAYIAIEGWNWADSLYMSVTTVTSVGFMEVHPLSPAGRKFTILLITLGVTGLGIWWALITAMIVELDLGGVLRRRRKMKQLEKLSGHFIICGAGRVGQVVLKELLTAGARLVVIERDLDRATDVEDEHPGALVLAGDATKEQVLTRAGVETARGLAACLADDAENLLVCLSARDLNSGIHTVARAFDEESMSKLRRAGADQVISPTITGGVRMASSLIRPHVISFLDAATIGADIDLRLEEAVIPPGSALAGRSLSDAGIPQRTGLVVLALRRKEGNGGQIYNPGPDTLLNAGDVMIVLGRQEQVDKLRQYAGNIQVPEPSSRE